MSGGSPSPADIERLRTSLVSLDSLRVRVASQTAEVSRSGGGGGGVGSGVAARLRAVEELEAGVRELQASDERVRREVAVALAGAGNGSGAPAATKKLGRDYEARLRPMVEAAVGKARKACFEARFEAEAVAREADAVPSSVTQPSPTTTTTTTQGDEWTKLLSQDQTAELRRVEQKAGTLNSLTKKVATLVAEQGNAATALAANSSSSRDDVIAGLNAVAEKKMKEASRHTSTGTKVTAVIGGAVGVLGGPVGLVIGAAAGAALGAAVGSRIATVSRTSIAKEVRDFKHKFVVQVRRDGSRLAVAEVYENQRWSPVSGSWSSENLVVSAGDFPRWSDAAGEAFSRSEPTPDTPTIPVAAHWARFVEPMDTSTTTDMSELDGEWAWEPASTWRPDVGCAEADAAGWQYAFSFSLAQTDWTNTASRMSMVRRRRWVRGMVWVRRVVAVPEAKQHEFEGGSRVGFAPPQPLSKQDEAHAIGATREVTESLAVTRATAEAVAAQGEDISRAESAVDVARVAAAHAERINRAVYLSGVIRNALGSAPAPSPPVSAPHLPNAGEPLVSARPANATATANADDPLDNLSRLTSEHLAVSTNLLSEVQRQDLALDRLAEDAHRSGVAVDKARRGI